MKISIKDFFSKCDQSHIKRRIWSQLLKKSLMENFIFYAVLQASMLGKKNFKIRVYTVSCHYQYFSETRKVT